LGVFHLIIFCFFAYIPEFKVLNPRPLSYESSALTTRAMLQKICFNAS
jgi:hypothetical protein